jgi:hypothetical protein
MLAADLQKQTCDVSFNYLQTLTNIKILHAGMTQFIACKRLLRANLHILKPRSEKTSSYPWNTINPIHRIVSMVS